MYCYVMNANGINFNDIRNKLNNFLEKKSYNENKIPYQVSVLLIDKKSYLWVGTFDDGLYRIHYTNTKNKSDSDRISISVKNFSDQLPDKHIRSILEDSKGNIWIGTRRQGIVQLSNNGKEQFTQQQYDLRKGLMSNWIRAIAEDKNGCIWIGSDLGIDKLIPVGKQFQVFNFSQVNNFFADIGAILPENNHSLWFSTNKGLVNIIDDELEKTAPPPLYITSVHLGDTSFNYNTHHREKKVQLKYNQNQAEFEFSAPSFINEKQILYSYHLAGSADTAWSEPASLHTVSYASLQPGNYKFEVRTLGWNGKWGLPATFLFRVRSPYWQTWWFFSLVGLCVLSLLYALYRYRIRQLMNLQKVRNRIATDLHDDIGATLSSISMYSDAVKEQVKTKLPHLGPILEKMGENSRSMVASMSDIVWAINPNNDDGEKLLQRM